MPIVLNAPGIKHSKRKSDKPVKTIAFNCNFRHCIEVESQNLRLLIEGEEAQRKAMESEAGAYTLPLLSST